MGVISKTDHPEADLEKAQSILKGLGFAGQIYPVSALTGEGIRELKKALKW
ncbi:EutP/PduV family microcompartment system protein [Desulfitibacter alkalitolerans]|uniref:EutP/PduV family microcompartment system protein n=1 Tax=Desulfitibacter alkalitolerans TaxID=264641 RepID=UPI000A049CAC